jgi:hypothetical protein
MSDPVEDFYTVAEPAKILKVNPKTIKSHGRPAHQCYHAAIADLRGKDPGSLE